MSSRAPLLGAAFVVAALVPCAPGNGGPFVLKYPGGDTSAKGVFAPLDTNLKPGRETRLRVVKEDLEIMFTTASLTRPNPGNASRRPPLVSVTAAYTIANPTDEKIEVDFGFPILRGIYMNPLSMMPQPDVRIEQQTEKTKQTIHPSIISNSAIYGVIRQRARETIETAIAADAGLSQCVARVRTVAFVRQNVQTRAQQDLGNDKALARAAAEDSQLGPLLSANPTDMERQRSEAREALRSYLTGAMKWNERDAALLVEFASLDFGPPSGASDKARVAGSFTPDAYWMLREPDLSALLTKNLGLLQRAIGEQKATQLFAYLASRFDPAALQTYESIFEAWGGDVRERALDLASGQIRPREFTITTETVRAAGALAWETTDPAVYARVDYLNEEANLSDAEKDTCRTILKNLPVVFTFAPMNLIHYKVAFEPKKECLLTVSYRQYAFEDTAGPKSYQIAYVVHPASMWDSFGPINVTALTPPGLQLKASFHCPAGRIETRKMRDGWGGNEEILSFQPYFAQLSDKTGEVFFAINAAEWDNLARKDHMAPALAWLTDAPSSCGKTTSSRRDSASRIRYLPMRLGWTNRFAAFDKLGRDGEKTFGEIYHYRARRSADRPGS